MTNFVTKMTNQALASFLCKERNEVIVEYALRDSPRPLRVAGYKLSKALPEALQKELPTVEEFSRDFPFLEVVKVRIDLERTVRALLSKNGIDSRVTPLSKSLRELQKFGIAPERMDRFLKSIHIINQAAHGYEIESHDAEEAISAGLELLEELRDLGEN